MTKKEEKEAVITISDPQACPTKYQGSPQREQHNSDGSHFHVAKTMYFNSHKNINEVLKPALISFTGENPYSVHA